ncbi:hypothetical protein [Hymenobacter fodinae]|uniref:Uncharacterized protein n=1 Tax=Hymenobacter fodinae TaxID=2510796 RepID=A0A4Z0P7B7_9BACT|nr:hypothetical protein [Hymenobacter fodinae]TGE08253.1 hypothetical protein EU556_11055 [Hymenobacter fodinae]
MKLGKSITRVARYAQGGLALAIALSTLTDKGLSSLLIEREPDPENGEGAEKIKTISLRPDAGVTIHRLEFEDDQAYYSDATQFGNNTYPKHAIGYKFAGKTRALDAFSKVADLTRTTHICKTRMGDYVIVGADNGLRNEKNDSGSGTAPGDFNGFDMVISGAESRKAELLTKEQFEGLLAQVDAAAAAPGA